MVARPETDGRGARPYGTPRIHTQNTRRDDVGIVPYKDNLNDRVGHR